MPFGLAVQVSGSRSFQTRQSPFGKGMFVQGCGLIAIALAATSGSATPTLQAELPTPEFRPRGVRVDLTPEQADLVPIYAPGGPALPIFMNRWGGTYYGGTDDGRQNRSSIVPGTSATVGGFSGTDAQWNEVMTCVADQFARFNVYVTDIEPLEGDYVESVVGGTPDQLGLPFGVGGVAPWDPFNCSTIANAVVYTFADVYGTGGGSMRAICETATQEIAHAFSVDHELLCTDPMTYLDGCGEKSFKDEYVTCGEYEPRECNCSRPSQNSVQLLYERLGASNGEPPPPPPTDLEVPVVSFISPEDGETMLANGIIEVRANASDDLGLASVVLEWDYSDNAMFCPGSGDSWDCEVTGDTHLWRVNVGVGSRSFRVAVRDVAGKQALTETRTIWLGETLDEERPNDTGAPVIDIVSPTTGAQMQAEDYVDVIAVITDDTGITQAGLVWNNNGRERYFPCPAESQFVNCFQEGSSYIWNVRVGNGSRSFAVYAKDLVGNETLTDVVTFDLTSDPTLWGEQDDFENNNTWDLAQPLTCGTDIELKTSPSDPDWFSVDAPEGQLVRVRLRGAVTDDVELVVANGAGAEPIAVESDGDILFVADGATRVAVQPNSGALGDYELAVLCLPTIDLPTIERVGCASAGSSADHALLLSVLGLLGVAAIRRRRR